MCIRDSAYIMAVKCYQPQLSFDIRPKEPFLEQYSRLSYDPDVLYRPDSVQFYQMCIRDSICHMVTYTLESQRVAMVTDSVTDTVTDFC